MGDEQQPGGRRLELNGLQVAAATAAAVTATVVASTLGVAGTIIGAVLASVISTVGSALYLASMKHTKERLASIPKRFDVTRVDGEEPTEVVTTEHPPTEVIRLDAPATGRATVTVPKPRPATKRWKTVAATALIVCALTFGVVTLAEALLGQPLAGLFGQADGATGTSLNHDGPQSEEQPADEVDDPAPDPDPTGTSTPSPTPTDESPSSQPSSPSPSPSSSSPSSSPSPTPADGGAEAPDAQGG